MASLVFPETSGLPGYLGDVFNAGGSAGWGSWNLDIILIAMMAFSFVTVLYMLSIAFNHQTLKNWCKSEYLQVGVTFLLVGAIVAMTTVLWPIMITTIKYVYMISQDPSFRGVSGIIGPNDKYYDPFDFSSAYIEQALLGCEQVLFRIVFLFNSFFEPMNQMSVEILGTEGAGGWYASLYSGFFKYLATNIANLALLHWVQIRFLAFIKYTMPTFIMIGMILRTFPFTRGTGGLMLAIGFGFFFVYPVAIAMLLLLQPLPDLAWCVSFTPPESLNPDYHNPLITNRADMEYFRVKLEDNSNFISNFIDKVKLFVSVFYMQSVFFPIVALIITFTFIRQTGAMFGADLGEIGRGLIKLI
jgi:hypothetical protein